MIRRLRNWAQRWLTRAQRHPGLYVTNVMDYPMRFGNIELQPGETVEVVDGKARQRWATETTS